MKSRRCLLSYLIILLLVPTAARAQLWSGLINSNRAVDWTQAGIPGGLPDASWPVCQTISAYSGSPSTINSALSSCASAHPTGGVVVLGSGTFNLSGAINLPTHGYVALRGQDASSTKLVFSSNSGSACPRWIYLRSWEQQQHLSRTGQSNRDSSQRHRGNVTRVNRADSR